MKVYEPKTNKREKNQEKLDEVFNDFEAKSNIVGLFSLLLKIDQRDNPHLYTPKRQKNND